MGNLFPSYQEVTKNFQKGPVRCYESQYFLKTNIHISLSLAMLVAACHVIRLSCTSLLEINQATKASIEPFPTIYVTFAHTFSVLVLL